MLRILSNEEGLSVSGSKKELADHFVLKMASKMMKKEPVELPNSFQINKDHDNQAERVADDTSENILLNYMAEEKVLKERRFLSLERSLEKLLQTTLMKAIEKMKSSLQLAGNQDENKFWLESLELIVRAREIAYTQAYMFENPLKAFLKKKLMLARQSPAQKPYLDQSNIVFYYTVVSQQQLPGQSSQFPFYDQMIQQFFGRQLPVQEVAEEQVDMDMLMAFIGWLDMLEQSLHPQDPFPLEALKRYYNAQPKYANAIFCDKHSENVLTWLLQVNLLFKARKVGDDKQLQYIIVELQDAALQWYLNQVQANEGHQPFTDCESFAASIKNLLSQIDEMHEADKIMYFTEGLKGATKAEINYHVSETLNDTIKLATSYDSAMYDITKNVNKHYSLQNKGKAPTVMKLNRVELESSVNIKPINIKKENKTALDKNKYKKQELCFSCEKKVMYASKDFINLQFVKNLQLEINEEEEDTSELDNTKACQSILLTKKQFAKDTKSSAELYVIILSNTINRNPATNKTPECLKDLVLQYENLFPDDLSDKLPLRRSIDHEISLQVGSKPSYRPIY
ncbi:17262_t:CDS:10 [Cetraspora pellucida]|uniref:17262_t:CDS:1 n=1 Tax=Cetraspora pellucida TaxID=1433469 RepID=A0ACA9JW21_9GLOM|nr:17262_t:CDS:10 [Cetraspora pellucida]